MLRLHELFQMLAEIVGAAKIKILNEKLKERFIQTHPSAIVAQGMTDELIATLTTRDMETDRMIFQLVKI